ncbi:MAG: ABC transporter substrate-binding protein [Deltaproteobacteria bacterium]|nr:ABC transporter substrate-binding protein [Deltaproteobacteria bacterium]
MVIPENLSRLVALAPNITEIVFDLGKEKMLVGVTTYSDYPEEAKNIPKVGSYIHLDLERIVALQPDLCLAIKDGNPIDTVMRLEALGIPVYAVDPRNLESVMRTLVRVGGLLHAEDKAEDIVADMRKRISRVDAMVAYVQKRPRVFFQIGVAPIVSIGSDTFIHELVVRAGGKNFYSRIGCASRWEKCSRRSCVISKIRPGTGHRSVARCYHHYIDGQNRCF